MVEFGGGGIVNIGNLAFLSSKGDILTHDGTDHKVFNVGSEGNVLIVDSGETDGLKWGAAPILLGSITSSSFTENTEAEIGTLSISAGDLAADDNIFIVLNFDRETANWDLMKLQIKDTSTTVTTADLFTGAQALGQCIIMLCPRLNDSSSIMGHLSAFGISNISEGQIFNATPEADWITTAFTIAFRGSMASGGTGHLKADIYRMPTQ